MSLGVRFPKHPKLLTITLHENDLRLALACLRRVLDTEPAVLGMVQRVHAAQLVEHLHSHLPKPDQA